MGRSSWTVAAGLAVILAIGGGWWASQAAGPAESTLTRVLAMAPADALAVNVTDWREIRRALGPEDIAVRAQGRDLASRSVLVVSAQPLDDLLGWSPASLEWEAYVQAPGGGALLLALPPEVSRGQVRERIADAGYADEGDDRWSIDTALLRAAGVQGPELLSQVTYLPGEHLVVAGASRSYLDTVVDVIERRSASLAGDPAAAAVAAQFRGADTVLLQTGTIACQATDLGAAGSDTRVQADAALASAGELARYRFAARGIDEREGDGQVMTFAMEFASAGVAAEQTAVRSRLTTGPFIGRSTRVEDELTLRAARSTGATAVLSFGRDADATVLMPASGPVLFAACA